MGLMTGKKGVIFGVSNTHGIAYGIAKQLFEAGAEIAFTYANEVMEKRVRPIAEGMNAKVIMSCDVTKEDEVKAVFDECEKVYGKLDFVIHAVAFAQKEDLMGVWVVMGMTRFLEIFSISCTCKFYVFNTFQSHDLFSQITNFGDVSVHNNNFHTVFVCHVNVHACIDFISETVLDFRKAFHYTCVVVIIDDCNDTYSVSFH